MFNGYNETPSISYEFNQERIEKKQENVAKWAYGHEAGIQQVQTHPNHRHSEYWGGKPNFVGVANVVKCNCTGCYPPTENQSYQGDTTRHRPWLPRTFPVPLNGSNESCKLPATYQWDNGLTGQGSCYSENNLTYMQDNGGKYPYYRAYQNSRLPEPNQPGVITSVKEAEKGKESPVQNGARQPAFCNPGYKRPEGRNFCDPNDKHSNLASYSVDQHLVRLPVVEPFIKAVPSNLSQNRVPSTGYRSVKENMPQPYIESGYCGDPRKMSTEADKRTEAFSTGQIQTGVHIDYSHITRDFQEVEPQKLFFDNARHPDYYSRNNVQDMVKRNNQNFENRKDCAMSQMNMSEQHYNLSRGKYQDVGANPKPTYEAFYSKELEKRQENPACFQRNEDTNNENMNVHARLPRSALLFNDPRFADRTQSSFPYQSGPAPYRNYLRPEYPYQGFNTQDRYEYPAGFQRNEPNEFRTGVQQMQSCEQFPSQQNAGFPYETHFQQSFDKMQEFYLGKNSSSAQNEPMAFENRKANYLEAIRSEDISKNGTSKISPLRLLRKKKFINVPQEPAPATTVEATPGLDVRKFWSTWADEEEENVAPTQMVVLDCQNIDPEQAKLLHLYESDPVRVENENLVVKGVKESTNVASPFEKATEVVGQKVGIPQEETEKSDEPRLGHEPGIAMGESFGREASSPPKVFKKGKSGQENRGKKKSEVMDKWTEKKFDFLKRAEESKAAEILRHEEEKKKIIETRLSLQQSLKRNEKPVEMTSPFDENSQSDSVEEGNADASNLPTCEYRRNKFLDYSERKVIVNGSGKVVQEGEESCQVDEIKKEEVKTERLDEDINDKSSIVKLKEESGFEMDDILKRMSEMNFDGSEIKAEDVKKSKPVTGKRTKKRKSEETESDERTDRLMVETVTKPTIKFSIQKSHDLKISFKVLNSSKDYFGEDAGGEDAQDKVSVLEDSKNSTECFTLRYKSFQRDSERRGAEPGPRKSRRGLRKKKRVPEETRKTPVLKIKKSRFLTQADEDPLASDESEANASKKTFANEFTDSDGFHVQETVDSAKIKLTFKRHKGNFETEYKINSSSNVVDRIEGAAERFDDPDEAGFRHLGVTKKSCGGKKSGTESCQNRSKLISDSLERDSFVAEKPGEPLLDDDFRNSSTSRDSTEGEGDDLESAATAILEGFPSGEPGLEASALENSQRNPIDFVDESGKIGDAIDDESKSSEGTDKSGQERFEPNTNHVIIRDEANDGPENKSDEFSLVAFPVKEEAEEISSDFVKSTKSPEIEINHKSGDSPETGNGSTSEINPDLENPIGIKGTANDESFFELEPGGGDDGENPKDFQGTPDSGKGSSGQESRNNVEIDLEKFCTIDDPLNESGPDGKITPDLEIPEDLENSLEDLIRDEFSLPKKDESLVDEMSPGEMHATEVGIEKQSESIIPVEGNPLTFDLDRVESSSPKPSFELGLEENLNEEEITGHSLILDEAVNDILLEKSECLEFEPERVDCPELETCLSDVPTDNVLTKQTEEVLPLRVDVELEDGEIIDSSDESDHRSSGTACRNFRKIDFVVRKIQRRRSVEPKTSTRENKSQNPETWSRKKFSKGRSCPPDLKFSWVTPETVTTMEVPVEEILLPMGPPPCESCFDLEKYKTMLEAKEKPNESISPKKPDSPFGLSDLEKCRNPSPPVREEEAPPQLGIFSRNSKIKFSFSKRSKFSKLSSNDPTRMVPPSNSVAKKEVEPPDKSPPPKEREIVEEVPSANVCANEASEEVGNCRNDALESVELLCEDLEESVEVMNAMTDLIRDEFYEYEDIPTSEDLTNGDELEMEKVNDDKFRNIMQNCIDNAKKFLNVGNLKLFSCSVDDLLELDCQPADSTLGEDNEPEKATNHISRDVLLTSCGDANEDLGLSENIQPGDISVDFVPSFCSDVCPEILPVDNWPYLEEEVTSSPTKSKQDEVDLIPSLEDAVPDSPIEDPVFCFKKGVERLGRKRVVSETSFHRNLNSDGETFRNCSKVGEQRRKTIDTCPPVPYGDDVRGVRKELLRLKNGGDEAEKKSLKCRLSLEKLTNKEGINFEKLRSFSGNSPKDSNGVKRKASKSLDYKSPSWQPKVMLFRISKNELRKMVRNSKNQRRSESKMSEEIPNRETSRDFETEVEPVLKKIKPEPGIDKLFVKPEEGVGKRVDERRVSEEKVNSVKPSLGTIAPPDTDRRKRKKSRFRNLHTKRKSEPEKTVVRPVDPEIVLAEIFKNCNREEKGPSDKDSGEKVKRKWIESSKEKRLSGSHGKHNKDDAKQERREKKHDHRDRRRERSEGRHEEKHKHREDENRKRNRYSSNQDRSSSVPERRRSASGGEEKKGRSQKGEANSPRWVCEVCGYDDAEERVVHIKNHPFHCQSCHLAFKTESHFISHLTKKHKDIRNQHHCLLCELSFDTEDQYQSHLETREHTHLESVEKNTINTLFTILTGAPCPVLGLVEMKPEWLPNQAGTVHFYHQATPLSLALQYLKMHRDLSSFSTTSSTHPS